MMQLAAAS